MGRDRLVDDYIEKAPDFARPILESLRTLAHRALPDAEEAIKWGMPHFTVNGKNVAGMAAFKAHCTFVIHGEGRQGASGSDVYEPQSDEPASTSKARLKPAMGQFGHVTSMDDLPSQAVMIGRLQAARQRVLETGSSRQPAHRAPRAAIPMPEDFASLLVAVPAAAATFDAFAPSHRRDYLEWITEAKTQATRERRMRQAVEWLAEGKKRNWKYEQC